MTARAIILAAAAPALLTACMQGEARERPAPEPAAVAIGESENCIPITQIRSSRVRDDWTIDFEGPGSKVWRNVLPNRCSGLKSEDSFTYETSLSQLCNTDIIYVLHNYGGTPQRGAGCGLGDFLPVRLED
jgi:hypothetical protein